MVYSRLHLYYGNVGSKGLREGHFDFNSKDHSHIKHYNQALSIVKEQMRRRNGRMQIKIGSPSITQSEEQASEFINLAAKNIKGSYGLIEITSCMHGNIKFSRGSRLEGYEEYQREELLEKITSLGFVFEPCNLAKYIAENNRRAFGDKIDIWRIIDKQLTFDR